MKRVASVAVLVAIMLTLVACSPQQKVTSKLDGVWYEDEYNAKLEFVTDTDFRLTSDRDRSSTGRYEVVDETHLRIDGFPSGEWNGWARSLGGLVTIKELTGDRMVLVTDSGGEAVFLKDKEATNATAAESEKKSEGDAVAEHFARWNELTLAFGEGFDPAMASTTKVAIPPKDSTEVMTNGWYEEDLESVFVDDERTDVPAGTVLRDRDKYGSYSESSIVVSLGDGYFVPATLYGTSWDWTDDGTKSGKPRPGGQADIRKATDWDDEHGRPLTYMDGRQRHFMPPYFLAANAWHGAGDGQFIDIDGEGVFETANVKFVPVTFNNDGN